MAVEMTIPRIASSVKPYFAHRRASVVALALVLSSFSGLWAYASPPLIQPQLGHSRRVDGIAFTRGDRYAVSTSLDGTLRIWDVPSGRELRAVQAETSVLAVSPDGKTVASGGARNGDMATVLVVQIWDIPSGSLIATLEHANPRASHSSVTSIAFTPDGKHVIAGSQRPSLTMWNLKSRRELWTVTDFDKWVYSVAVPAAGKSCLVGMANGKIDRRSLADGRKISTITPGHSGPVSSLSISSDGLRAVSASAGDRSIKSWKIEDGSVISTMRVTGNHIPHQIRFARDGKALSSGNGTTRLWDVESGEELLAIESGRVSDITTDGRFIITGEGGSESDVRLWDARDGSAVQTLGAPVAGTRSVAFSPDGRYLLTACNDGTLKLWDLEHLALSKSLVGHENRFSISRHMNYVLSVAFLPDGQTALSGAQGQILRWKIPEGTIVGRYQLDRSVDQTFIAIHPAGDRFLAMGPYNGQASPLFLWDVKTAKVVGQVAASKTDIHDAAFSGDGTRFFTAANRFGDTPAVRTWNLATGAEGVRPQLPSWAESRAVKVSACGRYAITQNGTYAVTSVWDVKTGRLVRDVSGKPPYATFHKEPWFLSVSESDDEILVREISTGRLVRKFDIAGLKLTSLDVSADGRYFAAAASNARTVLWSLETGERVSMVAGANDWIIYSDDGYFAGSRGGGRLVSVVDEGGAFGVDQFALTRNRPDLLLTRLGIRNTSLVQHYESRAERRLAKVGLTHETRDAHAAYASSQVVITKVKTDAGVARVHFDLSDEAHGLATYQVFVNDVAQFDGTGKPIGGPQHAGVEEVELGEGRNKIEISCINTEGVESLRAIAYADRSRDRVKRDLYFLAFGVSKHKDKSLNLRYAHKDAKDLARLFGKMRGPGTTSFSRVHTKLFLNEKAKKASIAKARGFLKKSKVDDVVVLFIAGHGLHDTTSNATYYFVTHDARLDDLENTAAEFALVETLLAGIPARNKLFLMDTCESGEADEKTAQKFEVAARSRAIRPRSARKIRGLQRAAGGGGGRIHLQSTDRYIYNDLFRRTGAVVFSSSRGGEYSYESDKLRNGLFTAAVIRALSAGGADKDADGVVTVEELRKYVSHAVSDMSGGAQNPTVDRDNLSLKLALPVARGKRK